MLNDAGVQGYGVIEGKGVEMVLTFGTGIGTALYLDGTYVPNLELAHHPFRKRRRTRSTSARPCSRRSARRSGTSASPRWSRRCCPIWNPRKLYLGGGNAKHLTLELPPNVSITPNIAGLLGGIALWHDQR